MLLIPRINKEYIDKYVDIEGFGNITQGFKKGKGVIFLSVHSGSWELSNTICANIGFPFVLFVRQQRLPRLQKLLDSYRRRGGLRTIEREEGVRGLIDLLGQNHSVGMTCDQGGKSGTGIKFFGKDASFATGALKLALKNGATIVPVFFVRIKGPRINVFVEPPFELKRGDSFQREIEDNLQALADIFQRYIAKYPQGYLWSYRAWKYSKEKRILVLSDGKTGHLRQSQAMAALVARSLKEKGIQAQPRVVEIKYKNRLAKNSLLLSSCLAGKYHCQGCLWCLRSFLTKETYAAISAISSDVVISCGSSLAPVNFVLSRENLAKSIVIMRPSSLGIKRFNLVVMPEHDRPPRAKNIVVTEGALNLINEQYLNSCISRIASAISHENDKRLAISAKPYIGLLIGGDTKDFHLPLDAVKDVIAQIKSEAEQLDAEIMVTTSRRTTPEIENLAKKEFDGCARLALLVIANEKNIPETVGAILALSSIVIVSAESISMISEAAASGKYVVVFNSPGLGKRHRRFLENLKKKNFIYLVEPKNLAKTIQFIHSANPVMKPLNDAAVVTEALKKIL